MIEGKLNQLPLSEVFQIIVTSQKTGILSLVKENARSRIFFEMGRVQYAYIIPGLHIGELLVRMDLLTAFEAQTVQLGLKDASINLGLGAMYKGFLDEDDLKLSLKTYITEILTELLSWKKGEFSFNEKSAFDTQTPPDYTFDAMGLLMEVIRRKDEWQRGLVSTRTVFHKIGDATAHTLPEGSWEVLSFLDGKRSASSIAAEIDLPDKQVYRVLRLLEEQDFIAPNPHAREEPFVLIHSKSFLLRRLLQLAIRRVAIQPLLSENYDHSKQLIAEYRPRALIIDKIDESTWDFVKEVKQITGFSQIPIILLESEPESVGLLKRWNRPKVTRIPKPFQELEVQRWVSQFVGRSTV